MLKPIILLTGPDASGKTTLANQLRLYLENKGVRAKIVRIRGTHTLAYALMVLIRDVFGQHGNDLHYYDVRIPEKFREAWLVIEVLSILPLIIIYYYFMRLKYAIISERSLVDVMVWLISGMNRDLHITLSSKPFRFLSILVTKYRDKTSYITADPYTLISRKPADKNLILETLPYYNALARCFGLKTINTTCKTIHESLETLTKLLGI